MSGRPTRGSYPRDLLLVAPAAGRRGCGVLVVAGLAEAATVPRIVCVQAEPHELVSGAWVMVGDGADAEAFGSVAVPGVFADAERVVSKDPAPEPSSVAFTVAAFCCCATLSFCR